MERSRACDGEAAEWSANFGVWLDGGCAACGSWEDAGSGTAEGRACGAHVGANRS